MLYVLLEVTSIDHAEPVGVFSSLDLAMQASPIDKELWHEPTKEDSYYYGYGARSKNEWLIFVFELDKVKE